jgi:hypothetical protein
MDTEMRELTADELDQVSGANEAGGKLLCGGILIYEADKNTDLLAGALKAVASKYSN